MDNELKRDKKITFMTILLIILLILFCFIIIFVITNKDKQIVEEKPTVITADNFIKKENIDDQKYLSVYKSVNLKKVTFTGITEVLVSNFYSKQDTILTTLENNIATNKEYIDNYNAINNVSDYTANSKIESIVGYYIKDDILSLLYLVEDNVDYLGLNNYITNIFIDLKNNSLVNQESILTKYNLTKEKIASEVFDSVLNKHDRNIIDKDTNQEIVIEEIKNKKDEYTKVLIENFDEYIYLYFLDNNLYLKYNVNDISEKLFNEELNNIKYSTLKINIESQK